MGVLDTQDSWYNTSPLPPTDYKVCVAMDCTSEDVSRQSVFKTAFILLVQGSNKSGLQ